MLSFHKPTERLHTPNCVILGKGIEFTAYKCDITQNKKPILCLGGKQEEIRSPHVLKIPRFSSGILRIIGILTQKFMYGGKGHIQAWETLKRALNEEKLQRLMEENNLTIPITCIFPDGTIKQQFIEPVSADSSPLTEETACALEIISNYLLKNSGIVLDIVGFEGFIFAIRNRIKRPFSLENQPPALRKLCKNIIYDSKRAYIIDPISFYTGPESSPMNKIRKGLARIIQTLQVWSIRQSKEYIGHSLLSFL